MVGIKTRPLPANFLVAYEGWYPGGGGINGCMPRKGHKSQKGQGDLYDEPKRNTVLVLTQTARTSLDRMAAELGISRSELVERVGRGSILLAAFSEEDKILLGKPSANSLHWTAMSWLGGVYSVGVRL